MFIVTVIMVGGGVSGTCTVTRVMRRVYTSIHECTRGCMLVMSMHVYARYTLRSSEYTRAYSLPACILTHKVHARVSPN